MNKTIKDDIRNSCKRLDTLAGRNLPLCPINKKAPTLSTKRELRF